MEKYNKPSLPNPKCIIEDLTTLNIDKHKEPLTFLASDENLQDAYNSYLNCKQLQNDVLEQQELSNTLEELNKKLVDNIESMKKQQIANE